MAIKGILDARSRKRSTALVTNIDFDAWGDYLDDPPLAMAFLDRSTKSTHCPHKGDASYFSIVTKSGTIPDAVWSYETPKDGVAEIKDHLAFYVSDKVTVERV